MVRSNIALLAHDPCSTASALSRNRRAHAELWAYRARRPEQGDIQRHLDDEGRVRRQRQIGQERLLLIA